eukprot:TRINITY_DN14851_c0_g1_i1.p1 TRINITY_DN14851_c0_g1~~TRINITY_DN14851_c0_g1_i1.p1  ORF type:complete len:144 (+),score=19.87 TRINITY_DN14851_c0_g1_i1:139-570(+)
MGSVSSSSGSVDCTVATNVASGGRWSGDERGTVAVRFVRIKSFGVPHVKHHFISVDIHDGMWRVYQWYNTEGDCVQGSMYACVCEQIYGTAYVTLGEFTLDQVVEAGRACSNRGYHIIAYNCNHWTSAVASRLTGGYYSLEDI